MENTVTASKQLTAWRWSKLDEATRGFIKQRVYATVLYGMNTDEICDLLHDRGIRYRQLSIVREGLDRVLA
jgi:hypothetical protein